MDRVTIVFYVFFAINNFQEFEGANFEELKRNSVDIRVLEYPRDGSIQTVCPDCQSKTQKREIRRLDRDENKIDLINPSNIYLKGNQKKSRDRYYFPTGIWGAGGMPFNVLYTPNSRQQKMMKFAPKTLPTPDERSAGDSLKKVPEVFYILLEDRKTLPKSEEKNSRRPHARKYYSFIPQLFVSYGW